MERKYIKNELIIKYLNHTLTETESEEVALWLREEKANCDFLFGLEELYQIYQWEDVKLAANTNQEWEKLENKIQTLKHSGRSVTLSRRIMKYAAIIVGLVFTTSYIFWQARILKDLQSPMIIITAKGEASQATLPDGSKVWLNACSEVSYQKTLFSGERRVQMSGEVYFEVAKDKSAPFIVESKQVATRVLGTKFNIRAYEDENYMTAMLVEGSILLTSPSIQKEGIRMNPGEKVICYDETGTSEFIKEHREHESLDWMQKKIHFRNQNLGEISRELEKQFNIEISFPNEKLKQERFTCDFENNENIYQILDILKATEKFDYTIKNKHIVLQSR